MSDYNVGFVIFPGITQLDFTPSSLRRRRENFADAIGKFERYRQAADKVAGIIVDLRQGQNVAHDGQYVAVAPVGVDEHGLWCFKAGVSTNPRDIAGRPQIYTHSKRLLRQDYLRPLVPILAGLSRAFASPDP